MQNSGHRNREVVLPCGESSASEGKHDALVSQLEKFAGKDVFWYTREKNDNEKDPRIDEIALVKQREEELMMEVLSRWRLCSIE